MKSSWGARMAHSFYISVLASCFILLAASAARAQNETGPAGPMTPDRMEELIERIDENFENIGSGWTFTVEDIQVQLIYDLNADRMRLITPVDQAANLDQEALQRLMQANFDSALDARYAIGRGVVWSTFIHPLGALEDEEFLSAIGQTVNLAVTYGSTYSSGALVFGGGDSQERMLRELIDELLRKGLPI